MAVRKRSELRRLRDYTTRTLFIVHGLKYVNFWSATTLVMARSGMVLTAAGTRAGRKNKVE